MDESVATLVDTVDTLFSERTLRTRVVYEPMRVADRGETTAQSLDEALQLVCARKWARATITPVEEPFTWRVVLDLAFREFPGQHPKLSVALTEVDDPLERWDALSSCAAKTGALEGHMLYDYHASPYTESWAWGSMRRLDTEVPGYPWGLIVTAGHLDRLGGIERWVEDAPVDEAERLAGAGRLMARARLTQTPTDIPEHRLRAWKNFLRPVLAPRQPRDPIGPPFLGLLPEDQPRPRRPPS